MGVGQTIANILYLTAKTPVDLNDNADIQHAKENEVGIPGLYSRHAFKLP